MSSFLYSDLHFQCVADILAESAVNPHSSFNWATLNFMRASGYSVDNGSGRVWIEEIAVDLANRLYELNEVALFGRYKQAPTKRRPIQGIRYTAAAMPATAQYKALACLRYQCSEDVADATNLYKNLRTYLGDMAEAMVSGTGQYDRAAWGIDAPADLARSAA